MCKVILVNRNVFNFRGFILYCEAFFSFPDVILIPCHPSVWFHCKHYCAKCTVLKRMWMCIVPERNKYDDVKSYFSVPTRMPPPLSLSFCFLCTINSKLPGWRYYGLLSRVLVHHEWRSRFSPQHPQTSGQWHIPVVSALGWQRQYDQSFKAIHGYIISSGPASATKDVSKANQTNKKKTSKT